MKFYQFNNFKENAIVFAENEGDAKIIYYKHFDKLDEDKLKNPEVIDIDKLRRIVYSNIDSRYWSFNDIINGFIDKSIEILAIRGGGVWWLVQ